MNVVSFDDTWEFSHSYGNLTVAIVVAYDSPIGLLAIKSGEQDTVLCIQANDPRALLDVMREAFAAVLELMHGHAPSWDRAFRALERRATIRATTRASLLHATDPRRTPS